MLTEVFLYSPVENAAVSWNTVEVMDWFESWWVTLPDVLQVTRLQQGVQQGEHDIRTAEGQISTMKDAQDKLLEELDATRARLRETSNLLTALQV